MTTPGVRTRKAAPKRVRVYVDELGVPRGVDQGTRKAASMVEYIRADLATATKCDLARRESDAKGEGLYVPISILRKIVVLTLPADIIDALAKYDAEEAKAMKRRSGSSREEVEQALSNLVFQVRWAIDHPGAK